MSIFDSFCDAFLAGIELAVVAPRLHIVRALVDRGDVPLPRLEVNNFLIVGEGDVPVVVVLVQADVDGGLLSRDPGVGLVDPVAQFAYMKEVRVLQVYQTNSNIGSTFWILKIESEIAKMRLLFFNSNAVVWLNCLLP